MHYDYLIVGAGLFGAVLSERMREKGKKCLVMERRTHIAGNVYTEEIEGIQVHRYGPHIFHTVDEEVWNYMNQFAYFNHFVYSPIANYHGELYNLPFNMNTFSKMWGINTPEQAKAYITRQIQEYGIAEPKNLEEQAICLVGRDIYEKLIKGYTEKQWGRLCAELPSFIIQRIPVRYVFDNNYFNHPYQGIPVGGYTKMVEKMLSGTEVILAEDFLKEKDTYKQFADKVIFTGPIDQYFEYCFGELEYRSLRFETEILDIDNFQGTAGMNYTDIDTPYTRIIEHKHFEFGKGNLEKTIITREYPVYWERGIEPYYPINDDSNMQKYRRYKELAEQEDKVIFGGRLGMYQYLDMDRVVRKALDVAEKI